jgi:retron-type reverse transcriptase
MDKQYNILTRGLPKHREVQGNGGLILFAFRRFSTGYTTTLSEGKGDQLYDQFKKEHLNENSGTPEATKYRNIYKKVWNLENLNIAYNIISKKKGASTLSVYGENLNGTSMKTLKKISKTLKNHSFKFKLIRGTYKPKSDGTKRPLGISNVHDKIVQKSISMVFEEIFEPIFKDSSHGFRPQRGCHTALKQISH